MRRGLLVDMSYEKAYQRPSGGGGVNPGNPWSFAQRPLQIPLTQNQDCLTKDF